MSSPSSDWFTRARHIFYGTAAALVEILQDPEKRTENLNRLSMDLGQLAAELEQKGEVTEQEAMRYLESLRDRTANAPAPEGETPTPTPGPAESGSSTPASGKTAGSASVSRAEMAELMELIHQVESLRLELERLRTESPPGPSAPS